MINMATVTQMFGRLSERTKLIGVAVLAFLAGSFFTGHSTEGGSGRYTQFGLDQGQRGLLDTHTGQVWVLNSERRRFERWAAIPYF